ncbi:MAG: hypothetical protein KZQ86_07995, partial [Candidatus Thiodiazotropha sp. (ex Lucinoma kastoroae)]|nr:hypothetical protein [Candidatus Thiodiazotropha sp. (ex Lucinoma kastoroae)]
VIKEFGYLDAPQSIKKILGEHATLAELDSTLWDSMDSVSKECLAEIVDILKPRFNNFKNNYIYSGGQLIQSIDSLPFSTRTKNAVMSHTDKFSEPQLDFGDMLSVPSFGVRSAIEFACVIEAASTDSDLIDMNSNSTNHTHGEEEIVVFPEIRSLFQVISAWALGEHKLESLAGALPPPLPEWPQEIKEIWSELENISTRELAGDLEKHYSVPRLVSQVLVNMDKRLLDIANERIFPVENTATLEELGGRLNITRERVRQLEQKALSQLERFKSNEFLPVLRRAELLRDRLGSAVLMSQSFIDDALNWAVEDFNEDDAEKQLAKALLFWLAGPYQVCENWLLTDRELPKLTIDSFLECRDERGLVAQETATEIMSGLGIKNEYHRAWLEYLKKFLLVEEGLIYFHGSILEKAKSLLQYFARPMTVEEMLEFMGSDSVRSVRQRLVDDPRFWRVNKQNEFVLAGTEGYDEYTGITDEIIQELELCGGQAPITHLVEKLARIYGVKESSVIAYLSTPLFTKDENGIVRVRDTERGFSVSTNIEKAAACYLTDDGTWCWRVKIDKDIVRGSGRLIPDAFAQQLGCDIGNKIEVSTECGLITLSWPLSSTTGASIGSLRQAMNYHGASLGDYLFIKATKPSVKFMRLDQHQVETANSNLIKLALLLGCKCCGTEDEAASEVATALGLTYTSKEAMLVESRQVLISRGEKELAELIDPPKLSVDDYINDMGRLFK